MVFFNALIIILFYCMHNCLMRTNPFFLLTNLVYKIGRYYQLQVSLRVITKLPARVEINLGSSANNNQQHHSSTSSTSATTGGGGGLVGGNASSVSSSTAAANLATASSQSCSTAPSSSSKHKSSKSKS